MVHAGNAIALGLQMLAKAAPNEAAATGHKTMSHLRVELEAGTDSWFILMRKPELDGVQSDDGFL
jgi:hypothetical protein